MNKSRTLILKTGLCGLALSSLFLLNNKAVVHADAVTDGSQSDAISWNSDSDAAQNVQNTQKADDDQRNAQSVQPRRAEMSTVSSVSAAPRTTNQNTVVQSPHVANVQDAQKSNPIVINNPAGDKVNVHYVNRDGGAITDPNVKDTTIDVTKTGQGSYQVPSGYNVNNPDGKYTISGGAFNGTNLKGNVEHHQGYDTFMIGDQRLDSLPFGDTDDGDNKILINWLSVPENANKKNWQYFVTANPSNTMSNIIDFYLLDPATAKELIENSGYRGNTLTDLNGNNVDQVIRVIAKISPEGQPLVDMTTKYVKENSGKYYSSGYKYFIPLTRKTDPTYDVQHLPVAFVDSNNNLVGMVENYSGKIGTSQNISLSLPTGYKLADGATLPTSVTFAKSDAPLLIKVTSNGQTNSVQNPANNTINVNFVDQKTHKSVGTAAIDLTKQQQGTNYYQTPNGWATDNNGRYDVGTPFSRGYLTITGDKGNNAQQLILNAKQAQDFFEAFRKGHDTDLSIQAHLPAIHPDEINLQDLAYNGVSTYDKENGDRSWENIVYNATKKVIQTETNRHMTDNYGQGVFDGYYGKITAKRYNAYTFTDNYHPYDASTNTVTVPVHKTNSFSFADNSGNVQSVSGNTVDVTLTKPQSVNPAMDTRCQAQATRTIQINFPDGQIPASYKGIVDSHGNLKQTVHFTRTATEDALTGNILQYGNWTSDNKDHNFIGFPERTLPRIPGYTLSIKPF